MFDVRTKLSRDGQWPQQTKASRSRPHPVPHNKKFDYVITVIFEMDWRSTIPQNCPQLWLAIYLPFLVGTISSLAGNSNDNERSLIRHIRLTLLLDEGPDLVHQSTSLPSNTCCLNMPFFVVLYLLPPPRTAEAHHLAHFLEYQSSPSQSQNVYM